MAGAGDIRAGGAYVEIGADLTKLQRDLKASETRLKQWVRDNNASTASGLDMLGGRRLVRHELTAGLKMGAAEALGSSGGDMGMLAAGMLSGGGLAAGIAAGATGLVMVMEGIKADHKELVATTILYRKEVEETARFWEKLHRPVTTATGSALEGRSEMLRERIAEAKKDLAPEAGPWATWKAAGAELWSTISPDGAQAKEEKRQRSVNMAGDKAELDDLAKKEEVIAAARRQATQEVALEHAKLEGIVDGPARERAELDLRHREELRKANEENADKPGTNDIDLLKRTQVQQQWNLAEKQAQDTRNRTAEEIKEQGDLFIKGIEEEDREILAGHDAFVKYNDDLAIMAIQAQLAAHTISELAAKQQILSIQNKTMSDADADRLVRGQMNLEAAGAANSVRRPLEVFKDEYERIRNLYVSTDMDSETYRRLLAHAAGALGSETHSSRGTFNPMDAAFGMGGSSALTNIDENTKITADENRAIRRALEKIGEKDPPFASVWGGS